MMKRIWCFLNQPLVVIVIVSVAVCVVLPSVMNRKIEIVTSTISKSTEPIAKLEKLFSTLVQRMLTRAAAEQRLEEIKLITITKIERAKAGIEKYMVTLDYTGNEILSKVSIRLTFRDKDGTTLDMFSTQVEGLNLVKKGTGHRGYFTRPDEFKRREDASPPKLGYDPASAKIEAEVVSVDVYINTSQQEN
ncbi:hypothetical protein ACFLS1_13025 [Verrucomicrobiota bacterium]